MRNIFKKWDFDSHPEKTRIKKGFIAVGILLCILFVVSEVNAAIPETVNIHGKLKNINGTDLEGTFAFNFSLYTTDSGGSNIYTQSQNLTTDVDGIYTTILTGLGGVDFEQDTWLEIQIESDSPMSPRIEISSVPSALAGAGGGAGGIVNGSLPWLYNESSTMFFNETHFNTSVPLLGYWTEGASSDLYYDSGDVGIGLTNPLTTLHLEESASLTELRIDSSTGDIDSVISFYNDGTKEYDICMDDTSSDDLKFIRSSNTACTGKDTFTITSAGIEMGTAMLYFDAPTRWHRLTPTSAGNNFFELDDTSFPIGIDVVRINGGQQGQRITVICSENQSKIIDESGVLGANINLNNAAGDFDCNVVGVGSTLELIYFDNDQHSWEWHETSRSVN